jgi:hypothetical protein
VVGLSLSWQAQMIVVRQNLLSQKHNRSVLVRTVPPELEPPQHAILLQQTPQRLSEPRAAKFIRGKIQIRHRQLHENEPRFSVLTMFVPSLSW